jgi:hypothetical protein
MRIFNAFNRSTIVKHFTIVNMVVGLIGLVVSCLFKFTGSAYLLLDFLDLNNSLFSQYLLSGTSGLTVKLAFKGVVES